MKSCFTLRKRTLVTAVSAFVLRTSISVWERLYILIWRLSFAYPFGGTWESIHQRTWCIHELTSLGCQFWRTVMQHDVTELLLLLEVSRTIHDQSFTIVRSHLRLPRVVYISKSTAEETFGVFKCSSYSFRWEIEKLISCSLIGLWWQSSCCSLHCA